MYKIVPAVEVLIVDGDHVPVTPLSEVVGSVGADVLIHIGAT